MLLMAGSKLLSECCFINTVDVNALSLLVSALDYYDLFRSLKSS